MSKLAEIPDVVAVPSRKPANVLANDPHPVRPSLPPTPSPDEIYYRRRCASLSVGDAAMLTDVTKNTWTNWESGRTRMGRTTWAWFLSATGGAMLPGGDEWEGWWVGKNGLVDTHGNTRYSMHEIRRIPYLYTRIRHLRLRVSELEDRLLSASSDRIATNRLVVAGELQAAGNLVVSLIARTACVVKELHDSKLERIAGDGKDPRTSSVFDAVSILLDTSAALIRSTEPMGLSVPAGREV